MSAPSSFLFVHNKQYPQTKIEVKKAWLSRKFGAKELTFTMNYWSSTSTKVAKQNKNKNDFISMDHALIVGVETKKRVLVAEAAFK